MAFHSVSPKYVLEVRGDNYCKVLNNIKSAGICAEDVKITEEYISLKIDYLDLENVEKIIKNNCCSCKVVENIGIYFKLKSIKNIKSYTFGIVLCAIILRIISLFLWNIEFEGNFTITDEQLNLYLLKNNIHTGTFINKVDCNALEEGLRTEYFDVTWVCAEIKGTNLIVHIKENYNKEISVTENKPYDLVAKHSSIIDSIVTRSGVPCVKKGDIVNEGDVLISGVVDIFNEYEEKLFTDFVNADGDVYGKTTFAYEDKFSLNHTVRITEEKPSISRYIEFFGTTIGGGIKNKGKYYVIDEHKNIKLFKNFYIPICIGAKKQFFYENCDKKYTKKEAQQLAEHNLELFLKSLEEKEMQILEKDVNIYVGNNECSSKGTVTVLEPLAKVSPINYQEEGTTIIDERN